MITFKNINLSVGEGVTVFKDLNLYVKEGEFITLIGQNGAGKSSLLNLIASRLIPTSGQVKLNVPLTQVSTVMQDPKIGTIAEMSIFENLVFAYLRGEQRLLLPFNRNERRVFLGEKLSLLGMGLEHKMDMLVSSLSGGQRQALSLIMAISNKCEILLLDEITAALDPKMADLVMEIASKIIRKEHLTALMITHNMSHALHYGDRLCVLNNGHIDKEYSRAEREKLRPGYLAEVFKGVF